MAPLSLRIVQDNGTITKKVKLDPAITVREAHAIVKEKINVKDNEDTYGLFLRSIENDVCGVWMEEHRTLSYYMLREGDRVDYMSKIRNLRVKMLDDSVRTLKVDQSKVVGDLMINICSRLGITNHEEYGLCLEEEEQSDNAKEKGAGNTATLTKNKKSQLKDRDLQFEQLSKKLKTDDNVEWIDAHKTLSEASVAPERTVLLMRRLFYSDRNVDSRDPVQLNLLYVQARDNILDARHPVTEDQAAEFAGIQCQIHFSDFQEEKHKPGFIENMKEYMPEQYVSAWGIEKKVLKEYRKHKGLSAVDAKHLYTKTARALPTYGVTFFLVKEKQKDKKKLVPRLLGINSEAILRLDEVTKEILQQWPLTHVKTYHAAKGEIFTLNFGDYSEKEYSVKTRDAYRIRDILEDYIDLIRKRMMAQFHSNKQDSSYITQDNISSSQANVVQHISNNPSKIVEQSFVGPSSIMPHEIGKGASQVAQIVTVQQIVVSDKGNHHQQAVKSEVGMRGDMSIPFTRRLNRLNSNSVKIVSLLTEPSETHIEDARKIVDEMNADLPYVRDGIHETIDKQKSDEEKKKLQDQMNELDELMKTLSDCTSPDSTDAPEAGDAAMKIADLTTQMYFSLNSELKRRSKIISRSRPSFVEDENTQKTLRKASFIAATTNAVHAIDESKAQLDEGYEGPLMDPHRTAEIEAAFIDKLGKLNAAIAHYMMAHSDPKNVDYETAVNSMHTINELMPEFAKDAQALASTKDPESRKQILVDAKALCDAIRKICASTGSEDQQKIQEAARDYTEASSRLAFTFGKGKNAEKENELLDLVDEVGARTTLLLASAQELTQLASSEAAAADVDAAGVRTAEAAKNLISQVQLTAPTISEPHCQSAVTAAAEALSSSVQQLGGAWKPMVEDPARHDLGEKMHHQVMDLARALDKLKSAYSGLGNDEEGEVFDDPNATQERQRLKFINTVSGNKKQWQQLENQLNESLTVKGSEAEEAHSRLSQRLGQLNAAISSLLAATSDRSQPDYATAELAINTIHELMPQVVQDTKIASASKDAAAKAAMMEHIKALCEASQRICDSSEDTPQGRSDAIAKFTNASGKLVFGISHRGNPEKENQILELSEDACQKTSQLLSGVKQLSEAVGGESGSELDAKGVICADSAQALLTTAQLTVSSISEPRCQSALASSIDKLSSSGQNLASSWKPLFDNSMHKKQVQGLEQTLEQLEGKLDVLRSACVPFDDLQTVEVPREQQKLQFVKTMSGAKEQIQKAQKSLDKPIPPPQNSDKAEAIQERLSGRLGELNAALAALLSATSDRERPDYKSAEEAVKTISDLLPYVVQDTQSTCANKDEATRAAMLDLIKELCEASRGICGTADGTNPQGLSDAASKFCDASGKLVYVVNPRANANRENKIMGLTAGACNNASKLLSGVEQLSQDVGGAQGQELDSKGAVVADAAQGLLSSAQVTAPSISEPHSKKALLSSIDKLSSSGQNLADSWKPLLQDPKHQKQVVALQSPLQQLQDQLDALRNACQIPDTDIKPQECQKLQFINTISGAKEHLQKAQKALEKPIPPPQSSEKAEAVQQRLSGRLGELNSAIAALLAATADRAQPDYAAAERAIRTVTDLMPHVVQDTQSTSANKDAGTRAAMLDLIRELCEASRAVCGTADGTNPQGLSDAVSKFSDASGKLVYVVNPRVNSDREKLIDDLSAGACKQAMQLAAGVQHAAGAAGAGAGAREAGAELADAAQTLHHTAQVTAPSISEPHCKKALLLSIDKLSSSGYNLADSWKPLLQDPKHQKQVEALQQPLQQLEAQLEVLRNACHMPNGNGQIPELPQQLQKLKFIKTMSGAKEQIQKAQEALDKPIPPPQSSDKAEAVQQRLSGRLGELNAAIAALLAATSDSEKLDYKTAEQAMKTITELMPHVVQDTQSTSANKDAGTRAAMLDLIRELCEASRGVCANADGTNPQGLTDAVSKFSDASGKLVYVVNPRDNADRKRQIIALSAGASKKASQLLSTVQKLPTTVEGKTGQELEAKSAAVDDAANTLMSTAQITAPSISEPHSKKAMLSSVDKLSSSAQDLVGSWKPLLQGYSWSTLKQPLQQLEWQLEELKNACQIPDGELQTPQEIPREQQKLQFVKTMTGVKERIQKAQKSLDKPIPPPLSSDKADAVQQRLSGRLGELNAAIAALLSATSDRQKPDYKSAEQAAKTISELLPYVVQDTQTTSANKDEVTRAAMLDLIKDLCEASRGICGTADGTNPQGLSDAVSKFSDVSGKLVYVVNPRVDEKREKQIIGISAGACSNASQLLSGVEQLSRTLRGTTAEDLDCRGAAVADAAQGLLATAQITASSISDPHCKEALLASIDKLSSSGQDLAESWKPLLLDPQHQVEVLALQVPLQQLEGQLETLRKACQMPDSEVQRTKQIPHEQQKLHFIKSMSGIKDRIHKAKKALDKPIPPPLSSDKAAAVQQRLSGRLGELNAAIAMLLSATADREKPYFQTAEKAVTTIADLLPQVIQDTQSASANKDDATRAAMLDSIKKLCAASEGVCAGADGTDAQALSEAVAKFSDASGKLVYAVSPNANVDKEQQIVSLSAGACNAASRVLSAEQQLSARAEAASAQRLDERAAAVADAAQALLASAQVTAPSISSRACAAALVSCADMLSAYSRDLAGCWAPLMEDPRYQQKAVALQQAQQQLETQIEALRRACYDQAAPPKKKAPPTPARAAPPPAPVRSVTGIGATSGKRTHDATREFLDRVRCEESQGQKSTPKQVKSPSKSGCRSPAPALMTDDQKRMHQLFIKSVDDAEKTIKKAEAGLEQESKSQSTSPAISAGDCLSKQARLQRNIALAGVEVASLVGANYADTIDYSSASQATRALPQLMSTIVEDGKILSSTVNDKARKVFLEDMLQMCASSRKICDAAKNDREDSSLSSILVSDICLNGIINEIQGTEKYEVITLDGLSESQLQSDKDKKLNDAAVEFGDKSAKLLYIVSNDVDPTLEKEIITRAKAIGDGVAQISVQAGEVAGGGSSAAGAVEALCAAGARCQDAAGKLIYTAKLVAPSIYETPCQDALLKSADNLSTELRTFTNSWKPFSSDPHHAKSIKELAKEADNLERILEGLKSDVKGGRIGQRREIEKLVVEDTPMRQLTMKIMEDAKKLSECPELSSALKREYIEYSKKLSDALRALDLANARCKRTPHDTNKRRDLENAIQNLQMILLQSRPTRGDKERSNIVDLRDYIDEVCAEADKLVEATSSLKSPTAADKKILQDINANGQKISKAAYKLTHSDDETGFDTSFEDILDVDQFGQECDDVIKDIKAQLQSIEDTKAKNALYSKVLPLTESCNMLRFATKSGISAAKSASLDSTLDDLDDIENRVIKSIVKDGADTAGVTLRFTGLPGGAAAGCALARAACAASALERAPLTAYIAACAHSSNTTQPDTRNRLLKHLYKLVHLLKTQTVTTSKRIATWQPIDDPEVATITEQILQEIQNPESKFQADSGKVKKIINESDLTKLLIPGRAKVVGGQKQQEDKLTQLSTKLNSMCGMLTLSITSPESLARSAHATSEAAVELSAVARGFKNKKEPVQCERIEEAVQEMSFATYGALKTAELVCQDPGNPNTRRRLHEACRSFNQSINKLAMTASSASDLKKECGSLSRSLQLQHASIQTVPMATSALPYDQCCEALNQQQEIVYKLKNDAPMSRQEFARSMNEMNEAVCKTTEISTQCAYLISVSDKDGDIAKKGPVDVPQIQKTIEMLQDSCMAIIGSSNIQQAKEETEEFHNRVQDYSRALDEAQIKVKDGGVKATITRAKGGVTTSASELWEALKQGDDMGKVTPAAVSLLEEVNRAHALLEPCPLVPSAAPCGAEAEARRDQLTDSCRTLINETLALVKEVNESDDDSETMTWVTFNTSKTKLLDAYDALLKTIRVNGQRAGILEGSPEDEADEDAQTKTYLEIQDELIQRLPISSILHLNCETVDLASKWLNRPMSKAEVKATGQQAVRHVIDIASKMSEDLKGSEREEIRNVITETEELLAQCSVSYDNVKYSVLMDRIKELKKAIQRGVVTRVVEDFIEADDTMLDLDTMVDSEQDEQKRKFLLERKIAELLAQLGRVTRTARFVADASGSQQANSELIQCSEQTELLAPMLVQAAQERITSPNDQAVIDNYKALLAKYAESISKVRELCDRAVDPMDFVQTAGDTMQRMRDESSAHNDDQEGNRTSEASIKLGNRTIAVCLSSPEVRRNPELIVALQAAQKRLLAATPSADCRASKLPDWKESTAEVLRTTSDIESCLGGENIFKKKPTAQGSNQQIYTVARELHESVRGWSARDNEIVAAARRVAVLMARLSEHMETDKKQALLSTSKSIVSESHEVAELARKLAHECTDLRIKTNLLQTCERIPTISAQLKMLTTVKSSSLGRQGTKEDSEAMDMLVGNAQSLMLSIQEVVKAAAGASVKIMSQRGPRLRWVRKNYY